MYLDFIMNKAFFFNWRKLYKTMKKLAVPRLAHPDDVTLNLTLPRLSHLLGLEDAFAKRKWGTEVVDYGVPYDFESIMHYPFTAFSKNGKPTISNKVPMNGKVPYVELSDGDAQQTNAMYKCNGKILHYTASSPGKFALSEWVEEAWNWSSTKVWL